MKNAIILIALIPQFALAGIWKFEEADAKLAIGKSAAIFEAKAVKIQKTLRLRNGKAVTEAELAKLEQPDDGSLVVLSAIVEYKAVFEIVKVHQGAAAVGDKFELEWKDMHRAMCGHLETRMLEKGGIWARRETEEKQYQPYPDHTGRILLETLKKIEQAAAGDT